MSNLFGIFIKAAVAMFIVVVVGLFAIGPLVKLIVWIAGKGG